MLVLIQASTGVYTLGAFLPLEISRWLSLFALQFCGIALGASTLHLGRPQFAYRAILGLKHSWLSREILVFGVFAKVALVYTVLQWQPFVPNHYARLVVPALIVVGLLGTWCSVMVYHVTRRPAWRIPHCAPKFLLSGFFSGAAITAAGVLVLTPGSAWILPLALLTIASGALKAVCEVRTLRIAESATLLRGPLADAAAARVILADCGLGLLILCALLPNFDQIAWWARLLVV